MPFFTEQILGEAKPTNAERLEKQREWVANLINSSEHTDFELEEPESDDSVGNISGDIVKLQENDITLTTCFEKAMKGTTIDLLAGETFLIKEGLLYRQSKEEVMQLVVPKCYRSQVLELSTLSLGRDT